MPQNNRQIAMAARPSGMPRESDFRLEETPVPSPGDGEFLVRTMYLSVDPYMRALMGAGSSYARRLKVGEVIPGAAVGVIVASRHAAFADGDTVAGDFGWREYAISDGVGVERVDPAVAPITTALGILGMTGMTAYFGLLEVGQPREGQTVFVTAAAGAVGSTVGQIALIKGCRAVGSVGTDEKAQYLVKELGFSGAFNYKTEDVAMKIRELCPQHIDVFFDNTGGPVSDAAIAQLNTHARVVVCGQIDQYNSEQAPQGPRILWRLLSRQARAEGFMVFAYAERFGEARQEMLQWMNDGRLKHRETVFEGLENAPKAFIGLFTGANIGKTLVKVSEEPS